MVDFKLGVLHSVQEHVDAGEVVGGDVIFLTVYLADAGGSHLFADIQQQRSRTTGKIQHLVQFFLLAGLGFLTVQYNDFGKDAGNLLRRVKLPGLLAGTCALPIRYS